MKRITYIILLTLLFITGCTPEQENNTTLSMTSNVFTVMIDGHKYVVLDGYHKGAIVHAESCWCKETKKEDEE